MAPSLWTLNVMTTCPLHRHRGVRHEPVALDLRDEAANPRPELDALRVELDRRPELPPPPCGLSNDRAARTAAGSAARRPAGRPAPAARRSRRCCAAPGRPATELQRGLRVGRRARRCWSVSGLLAGCRIRRGPCPRALLGGGSSTRSGVLPRANGSGFVGFGARSRRRAPRDPGRTARRARAAWAPGCRGAAARRRSVVLSCWARCCGQRIARARAALLSDRTTAARAERG